MTTPGQAGMGPDPGGWGPSAEGRALEPEAPPGAWSYDGKGPHPASTKKPLQPGADLPARPLPPARDGVGGARGRGSGAGERRFLEGGPWRRKARDSLHAVSSSASPATHSDASMVTTQWRSSWRTCRVVRGSADSSAIRRPSSSQPESQASPGSSLPGSPSGPGASSSH